eukprot:11172691-Lingulodinium_polyedra.AAC.1
MPPQKPAPMQEVSGPPSLGVPETNGQREQQDMKQKKPEKLGPGARAQIPRAPDVPATNLDFKGSKKTKRAPDRDNAA